MTFEFKSAFDGNQPEIPTPEQLHTAKVFSSFVDDMLLNNIGKVVTSYDGQSSLPLTALYGGHRVEVCIKNFPNGRDYKKLITMQVVGKDGRGGDVVDYRLGEDGIVRRVDIDQPSEDERRAEEVFPSLDYVIKEGVTVKEVLGMISMALEGVSERSANLKLETIMGVNNQPIGLVEADQMMQFVDSARTTRP